MNSLASVWFHACFRPSYLACAACLNRSACHRYDKERL